MRVLITGINGQDGSYLSELLLESGYEVHGIIRRNSIPENQESRIHHIENKITTHYGDLQDASSLEKIMNEVKPHEIYNLAAQSHVRISSDIPQYTASVNAIGVLNMLEAMRKICPHSKFYQASSSEMFGNSIDDDGYQREITPMNPVSPYGCSKVFGYNISRHYRKAYGLNISNGILFNHESPRRGSNFVTTKVIKAAVRIFYGSEEKLELGNLESFRDWGHSKDYVRAMTRIIGTADDFVVATGSSYSVRDMIQLVFSRLDLDYQEHIVINQKFIRPDELKYLKGDATKIREKLNWKPLYNFEGLIMEMIEHWKKELKNKII